MKDLFIKFLKEKEIFVSFKKNYNVSESLNKYLKTTHPSLYLGCAFGWSNTEEGFDFWEGTEVEWETLIEQQNETNS